MAKAIGAGTAGAVSTDRDELPEPLASVVDYLGEDLDEDGREFVPSAELAEGLDLDPLELARQMAELVPADPQPGADQRRDPPGARLPHR